MLYQECSNMLSPEDLKKVNNHIISPQLNGVVNKQCECDGINEV